MHAQRTYANITLTKPVPKCLSDASVRNLWQFSWKFSWAATGILRESFRWYLQRPCEVPFDYTIFQGDVAVDTG
eukprot:4054599-Amphidinium_carterae.4